MASGVTVSVPLALRVTPAGPTSTLPPTATAVPLMCVTVSVWPSGSLSLASTATATATSSFVVAVSFPATGGAFDAVTLSTKASVAESVPSLAVT